MSIGAGIAIAGICLSMAIVLSVDVKIKIPTNITIVNKKMEVEND